MDMDNELKNRLRALRKLMGLTQKDAADRLELGQTTVANYENGTRVPDLKTISALADLYGVTVDYLLGRSADNEEMTSPSEEIFQSYLASLQEGDKAAALEIISSLRASGTPNGSILHDYIERALIDTGIEWEKGKLDVWREHLISAISLEIMSYLRKESRTEKKAPRVLAFTPGAESHLIGLRMVSDILEETGINVDFLGSSMPTSSILSAIRERQPSAVLMSVTMASHLDSAEIIAGSIRETFGDASPEIILGGSIFRRMEMADQKSAAGRVFMSPEELALYLNKRFKSDGD